MFWFIFNVSLIFSSGCIILLYFETKTLNCWTFISPSNFSNFLSKISILADVINRYYQSIGYDTFFLTGTDEHGQKVQEAAKKNNVLPKEHVDQVVQQFKEVWANLNIEY